MSEPPLEHDYQTALAYLQSLDDETRLLLLRVGRATHWVKTVKRVRVILFKPSGKYYTEEDWAIPTPQEVLERGGDGGSAVIPYCMRYSSDWRRIGGGPVLVPSQDPWGFPQLFPRTGPYCWCGANVGQRTPGDQFSLGCLEDINHDWSME